MGQSPAPSKNRRTTFTRIIAIVFVVALSIYIFSIRDQTEALIEYGYTGLFLFSVITSATIILPAPGLLIVFALGTVLNPVLVGIVAGVGATLGELSGYIAGYSGRGVVEDTRSYDRIRSWMENNPNRTGWLILLLGILPLPIFDLAGLAAGTLRFGALRFLMWAGMGKIIKMIIVAFLGVYSINLFGLF